MTRRYRTKGKLDTTAFTAHYQIWTACSNTGWDKIGAQQLYATGEFSTMHDEVVPDFRARSRKGEVFFNALTKNDYSIARSAGNGPEYYSTSTISCSGVNRNTGFRTDGNQIESVYNQKLFAGALPNGSIPPFFNLVPDKNVSDAVIEAATRAQDRVGRTDSNLWESVAEIDKSLAYLDDTLKQARSVFSRRRRKAAKGVAGLYLGWRYGLMPLLSDVHSAVEGLQKAIGVMRMTSRGSVSLREQRNQTITSVNSALTIQILEQCLHTVTVRASVLSSVDLTLLNRVGFTYKGLVTLPYELVNKSFVLDWFANVGDFIGAMTPSPGWSRLGSCVTIKHDYVTSFSALSTVANSGWTLSRPYTGGLTARRTLLTRTAGVPLPGIVAKSDFRFDKVDRVLDSLALFAVEVLGKDSPAQFRRRFKPSFFDNVKWYLP